MFHFTLIFAALWEVAMASPIEEYPFLKADAAAFNGARCAIFVAENNSQPNVQTLSVDTVKVQGKLTVKECSSDDIATTVRESSSGKDDSKVVTFERGLPVHDITVWKPSGEMEEVSPKAGQKVWMLAQDEWKEMVNHYDLLKDHIYILSVEKIVWVVPSEDGAFPPLASKATYLEAEMKKLEEAWKKLEEGRKASKAASKADYKFLVELKDYLILVESKTAFMTKWNVWREDYKASKAAWEAWMTTDYKDSEDYKKLMEAWQAKLKGMDHMDYLRDHMLLLQDYVNSMRDYENLGRFAKFAKNLWRKLKP